MNAHWKMRFDYAAQDPAVVAGSDSLCLYLAIYTDEASSRGLTLWFRDESEDGILDIYVRDPEVIFIGDPELALIGSVPGFVFSPNINLAPIKHEVIIEGHNDLATPTFDLTIRSGVGVELAHFPGLTYWLGFNNDPPQGESAKSLLFVGDSSSTGRAKIDNVEMGSFVPEPSCLVLLGIGGVTMWRRRPA